MFASHAGGFVIILAGTSSLYLLSTDGATGTLLRNIVRAQVSWFSSLIVDHADFSFVSAPFNWLQHACCFRLCRAITREIGAPLDQSSLGLVDTLYVSVLSFSLNR